MWIYGEGSTGFRRTTTVVVVMWRCLVALHRLSAHQPLHTHFGLEIQGQLPRAWAAGGSDIPRGLMRNSLCDLLLKSPLVISSRSQPIVSEVGRRTVGQPTMKAQANGRSISIISNAALPGLLGLLPIFTSKEKQEPRQYPSIGSCRTLR